MPRPEMRPHVSADAKKRRDPALNMVDRALWRIELAPDRSSVRES